LSAGSDRPIGDRPGQIVFALLVLACFVAFFVTQRLKHTPTAVQSFKLTPFFSPSPAGHIKAERISFKLSRADEVTVTVVKGGEVVATLMRELPVARYKALSLRWNGRRGTARSYSVVTGPDGRPALLAGTTGTLAAPGEYHVRVSLRRQQRTVESPHGFTLVVR